MPNSRVLLSIWDPSFWARTLSCLNLCRFANLQKQCHEPYNPLWNSLVLPLLKLTVVYTCLNSWMVMPANPFPTKIAWDLWVTHVATVAFVCSSPLHSQTATYVLVSPILSHYGTSSRFMGACIVVSHFWSSFMLRTLFELLLFGCSLH